MSADIVPPAGREHERRFQESPGRNRRPDDDDLRELIVDRIVALAKDGVYDIEGLSSRALSSLKPKA